jgi:hypothetical protein
VFVLDVAHSSSGKKKQQTVDRQQRRQYFFEVEGTFPSVFNRLPIASTTLKVNERIREIKDRENVCVCEGIYGSCGVLINTFSLL